MRLCEYPAIGAAGVKETLFAEKRRAAGPIAPTIQSEGEKLTIAASSSVVESIVCGPANSSK